MRRPLSTKVPSGGGSCDTRAVGGEGPRRLRDMLLEVGCSVLEDEGLSALTFKTVFERLNESRGVRLTNGSVIGRVWRDQADFRADVLVAVALEENDNEVDRTLRAVGGVLEEMDLSSPGPRPSEPSASSVGSVGPPICRSSAKQPKQW